MKWLPGQDSFTLTTDSEAASSLADTKMVDTGGLDISILHSNQHWPGQGGGRD